ncbi:MAG: RNA polymerase subunit sigma-70, partial [Chloroflexota bacterium]
HVSDAVRKLERCRVLLARRLGRAPSAEELSGETGVPVKKIEALLKTSQEPLSLDALLGESEETPLGDLLVDESAVDPEASTVRRRTREAL